MPEKEKTELKIGIPRERTLITPEGKFNIKLEIPYTFKDANYSVMVDKEGATSGIIEAAVRADAQKIVETSGKTITL